MGNYGLRTREAQRDQVGNYLSRSSERGRSSGRLLGQHVEDMVHLAGNCEVDASRRALEARETAFLESVVDTTHRVGNCVVGCGRSELICGKPKVSQLRRLK